MSAQLTLTARLNPSAGDARRGIVRVHPEALTALGLREWDAVRITGARVSAAVVAAAPADSSTGTILLDDISFSNTGVRENAQVVVGPVQVQAATRVTVTGSALASQGVDAQTLRRALLGKVLSVGDTVSLLPRDLGPELTASEAVRALARSVGITWTTQLLTVTATDPGAPVSVQPNTA
ncbi:ATPase, partial [Gordonia sp. i37]